MESRTSAGLCFVGRIGHQEACSEREYPLFCSTSVLVLLGGHPILVHD